MQDARVHLGVGPGGGDGFGQALEPVADHEAHVLDATVFDFGEHREPEFGESARVRANLCEVAPELSRIGQACEVDVVGEVDEDGLVGHAVGVGDEFGVDGADEVDQAGGAQDAGFDADRAQGVFDVAVGCGGSGGFGLCCDEYVGVVAAQRLAVIEASLQRGPGPWV
jgi:hypothetical protein